MDKKEKKIFEHYKEIIERRIFNEYDILRFLIFMRNNIKKQKYPLIYEFADLIAHRRRDRGIVLENVERAYNNNYEFRKNSNLVIGYVGIGRNKWIKEWKDLGTEFNININNKICKEITICIFSLAQYTEYKFNNNISTIELFIYDLNYIGMCTTTNEKEQGYICLAKCGKFQIPLKYNGKIIDGVVETERIGKTLYLMIGNNVILST